ncbi:MAG: hypothetical protein EB100_08485, partial [Crocinitomicaceae bacterium]|nr:hypothetical protein [Crocinitomicaceae bacterium]
LIYGKLYNFNVVSDTKNVCPVGWHIPSYKEWHTLIDFLGGRKEVVEYQGNYIITHISPDDNTGGKMKSKMYWEKENLGANNHSLFTGIPGGYLSPGSTWVGGNESSFDFIGRTGYWWSSSSINDVEADCLELDYSWSFAHLTNVDKSYGLSIRCLKD